MKKIFNILMLSAGLVLTVSCQKDFEKINTDFRHPTEQQLEYDGLKVGGFLTSFQQCIFPVGTTGTEYVNDYQIPYTLAGACWMGYMSPAQNKWVGKGFPSYSLKFWSDYTFNVMYRKAMGNYIELKARTENDPAARAMIEIIKVAAIHKATDTFGPIPYSQDAASILAGYESQEKVYKAMLSELDAAVSALNDNAYNVLPNYDMIYSGNYQKWIKLANSLMLRLAMRVVYADEELARTYAEKAVSNPFGLIESVSDIAQLSAGAGIILNNPLVTINGSYNDVRMGAEMYSFLMGYKDPRISCYFTKGNYNDKEDYYAVFKSLASTTRYLDASKFSRLNVKDETPIYIMKASEVAFLRAEGALRGWNMGSQTAQKYYEDGVTLSFKENKADDSSLSDYLSSENLPANYVDAAYSSNSKNAVSTITVKWNEAAQFEESLERIITQKYIALYPDGQEAWSEYRRTGYPKIFEATYVQTDSEVSGKTGPTRIPYSNKEYTDNLENVQKAVEMLGGPDNGATRLWWDKKQKN